MNNSDAGVVTPSKVVPDPSSFSLNPSPAFIKERLATFVKLYELQQNKYKELEQRDIKVSIELDDRAEPLLVGAKAHVTTPLDLAKSISKKLAESALVAEVLVTDVASTASDEVVDVDNEGCDAGVACSENWIVWDLTRPLESNCRLKILDFTTSRGQHVFWHSSAHILGSALESLYGGYVTIGPAISQGFYYDVFLGNHTFVPDDMKDIAACMQKISQGAHLFQRLVCTREEALELMKHNPFKVELIKKKVLPGQKTVCYRCGDFVDLCRGPHLVSTDKMHSKGFEVTKFSSCYWLSKNTADVLQRVYAISFPAPQQLKEHQRIVAEAKLRDHRTIGTNLGLFHFDTIHSPGSCFWLPRGVRVYNRLQEFMRENYRLRGYQEVITPNIFSCDLWKRSGHYDNYKENMYMFTVDEQEWGMKAMNCPGHCLMFKQLNPSYRQLPLRMADFGVLHRNELVGSLGGLTRVRRFQQDDAHIFCTPQDVFSEVKDMLQFVHDVYQLFGFDYIFKLSTKPEKALGDLKTWQRAEEALQAALDNSGRKWILNPGDGAFYGPKIDIVLYDCLGREHQCGTIQLDFNLPLRFNLEYRDKDRDAAVSPDEKLDDAVAVDAVAPSANAEPQGAEDSPSNGASGLATRTGYSRPVIIHRAIFGSFERFIAIVLEQTGGKLPFWLSPTQLAILPLADRHNAYCQDLGRHMLKLGIHTDVDVSNNTVNKKIKNAQDQRYCFMAIVGDKELETGTVSLRPLDTQQQLVLSKKELEEMLMDKLYEYKRTISIFQD